MKNKVICILVVVGALFVSFMFTSLDQKALFARVHQHRMITSAQPMDDEATRLPIVSIDTQGKKIPGEPVIDQEGNVSGYTVNELGEKMSEMEVSIYDDETMINRINNNSGHKIACTLSWTFFTFVFKERISTPFCTRRWRSRFGCYGHGKRK